MITNIVMRLTVTLLTNTVESVHPSGTEKIIQSTIVERHVVEYVWNQQSHSVTNDVFLREDRKRLVTEWKEVPMRPDFRVFPPTPGRP